ncbi:hypothetical protein BSK59_16005 [Paenibacillus odorifer]|nr:hypothetical protein BSK59_16005 [Paenibacillus odorifer]
MWGINIYELMWKYITFQWNVKPKFKDILVYPFKAILFLLILGFAGCRYGFYRLMCFIIDGFYNIKNRKGK